MRAAARLAGRRMIAIQCRAGVGGAVIWRARRDDLEGGLAWGKGVAILVEVVLKRSVEGLAYHLRRRRNPRGQLQLIVCAEAR